MNNPKILDGLFTASTNGHGGASPVENHPEFQATFQQLVVGWSSNDKAQNKELVAALCNYVDPSRLQNMLERFGISFGLRKAVSQMTLEVEIEAVLAQVVANAGNDLAVGVTKKALTTFDRLDSLEDVYAQQDQLDSKRRQVLALAQEAVHHFAKVSQEAFLLRSTQLLARNGQKDDSDW